MFRIIIALLFLLCSFVIPFQANAQIEQRSYLTLEILQDKVSNLVQAEGKEKIDLSNFIIDISNSDNELNQQFYQEINNTVSKRNNPIGIDFSNSIIQGNFKLNQLGIYSAVGEGALSSLFTLVEQEQINQYYPLDNSLSQDIPKVNIFRGGLNFAGTIFTGEIKGDNSLFLKPVIATSAKFQSTVKLDRNIFGQEVDFSNSTFEQGINISHNLFFPRLNLKQLFKLVLFKTDNLIPPWLCKVKLLYIPVAHKRISAKSLIDG